MKKKSAERLAGHPGKWTRRERKKRKRMAVSGKSVFRIQKLRRLKD